MTLASLGPRILKDPFLPVVGPVHPSELSEGLWASIVKASSEHRFAPFDKSQVWPGATPAHILHDYVIADDERIAIPVQNGKTVTVICYGDNIPEWAPELAASLADQGIQVKAMKWFAPVQDSGYSSVRVQLKEFSAPELPIAFDNDVEILMLDKASQAIQQSFSKFCHADTTEGFRYLDHLRNEAAPTGPVIVAATNETVVGAIGPMWTLPDSIKLNRLLPQYFLVGEQARGQGVGRSLWRHAMAWGYNHGADYQLLQTESGGASERLCESEGLQTIGFVHKISV